MSAGGPIKWGMTRPISVEMALTAAQDDLVLAVACHLPEDELERRRAAVDEWRRLLAEHLAAEVEPS